MTIIFCSVYSILLHHFYFGLEEFYGLLQTLVKTNSILWDAKHAYLLLVHPGTTIIIVVQNGMRINFIEIVTVYMFRTVLLYKFAIMFYFIYHADTMNTQVHETTKHTPYELVFEQPPRSVLIPDTTMKGKINEEDFQVDEPTQEDTEDEMDDKAMNPNREEDMDEVVPTQGEESKDDDVNLIDKHGPETMDDKVGLNQGEENKDGKVDPHQEEENMDKELNPDQGNENMDDELNPDQGNENMDDKLNPNQEDENNVNPTNLKKR